LNQSIEGLRCWKALDNRIDAHRQSERLANFGKTFPNRFAFAGNVRYARRKALAMNAAVDEHDAPREGIVRPSRPWGIKALPPITQ
jgi:hypothetical protein